MQPSENCYEVCSNVNNREYSRIGDRFCEIEILLCIVQFSELM